MARYLSLLLCITGAAAFACSKDKPAQSAYESRPADQDQLTPASSDSYDHSQMDHSRATPSDAAPATRDPSETGSSGTYLSPDSPSSGSSGSSSPGSSAPDTIPPRSTDPSDPSYGGDSMRGSSPGSGSSSSAPDNTARNERDRSDKAVTPMDQGQSQADLDITQKIRQAVMKDDKLSFTAKNVKIVTRDGKVTLRGTVPTYEERVAIENAARNVAGQGNVTSELEVKK